MQIVSLLSLIKASDNIEPLIEYLSTFKIDRNQDVESFFHHHAILNEKRAITRTFLIIDTSTNNNIVGYFTLMIKPFLFTENVSKEMRKKLSGDKHANLVYSILIAQLARSDMYKDKILGKKILELALESCERIFDLIGLRIVCVEYDDIPILQDFYLESDFKILQINSNGKVLAFLRF